MSSSHISKLPEDVLIRIFRMLHDGNERESKNLINATLVCRRWNQIVQQSVRLMDKLVLEVNTYNKKSPEGFKITRRYRHAKIEKLPSTLTNSPNDRTMIKILNAMKYLENHLTTIDLHDVYILPEDIEIFSQCKYLHTLNLGILIIGYQSSSMKQKYEFSQLRKLRFYDSRVSLIFLKYIECKQLEVFYLSDRVLPSLEDSSYIISFLNQLDRCEEISLTIPRFSGELKPKFLWQKLKLRFINTDSKNSNDNLTDIDLLSIQLLCQSSQTEARICIDFVKFRDVEICEILWSRMFNYCKDIEVTLTVMISPVPSNVEQLEIMNNMTTLSIDTIFFEDRNFPKLAAKLVGVTKLEIYSYYYISSKCSITRQYERLLQPFFNQIRELNLPENYVFEFASVVQKPSELFKFEFNHLKTLNFDSTNFNECYRIDSYFKNQFFRQNNVSYISVNAGCNVGKDHLKWFEVLQGTSIKTCNITKNVNGENSSQKCVNWREAGADEEKFFGRLLTEDENNFFV